MKGKPSMSLAEMAARAAAGSSGRLVCPKCGCEDFRTYGKGKGHVLTRRYKACRHCGCTILTEQEPERFVRLVGDDSGDAGDPSEDIA